MRSLTELKKVLDREVEARNNVQELDYERADPLMVARRYDDEFVALVCALFAYGNAKRIVYFLDTLNFSLLDASEEDIRKQLSNHYYRFQTSEDIIQLFITFSRIKKATSLEALFMQGYSTTKSVLSGVYAIMEGMQKVNDYQSKGYLFLVGKQNSTSAYKRWMMFLRWMVRKDSLDLGLWKGVCRSDLLLPLDTHTFKIGHTLGLLKRKSCDLKAVLEITKSLKKFDKNDPVKYDFALYRLGQEKLI